MNISIIGVGYVGLPTGLCLASFGHDVNFVDVNQEKIDMLKEGKSPIYERGIDEYLEENKNRISFSTDFSTVRGSEAVILAVGTPSKLDGSADLSMLFAAANNIRDHINTNTMVAIKSTVPVGTNRNLTEAMKGRGIVVSLPEFLREGTALDDFMRQDRIVVGCRDYDKIKQTFTVMFAQLLTNGYTKLLVTTPESAEMIKYASNAFLAVRLQYVNELADLCEEVGANIQDVTLGMGMDKRIGKHFLNASCGYGGSCFPKDTRALLKFGNKSGMTLVRETVKNNVKRQLACADRIKAYARNNNIKKIAVWGLAFKNGTDDCRESPALEIVDWLMKDLSLDITVYDPKAMDNAKKALGDNVKYANDMYECTKDKELLVVLTEWRDFGLADLDKLGMASKNIIDYRGVIHRKMALDSGYNIYTVGIGYERGNK